MNNRKKFGFATAAAGLALLVGGFIAPTTAGASGHTLVVNGVSYSSYKVSGPAWHFETPAGVVPVTASVAERSQSWDDDPSSSTPSNGLDNLPCVYGIHWISNANVLTISHCLAAPGTTTTTDGSTSTTDAPTTTIDDDECDDEHDDHEECATTTTIADTTTSTTIADTTTSTTIADTTTSTTIADTTTSTTIADTTTTAPATTTPSPTPPPTTEAPTTTVGSEGPTTTALETTTTHVGSEGPTTTALSESGGPTTTAVSSEPGLPRTGASQNALIVLGLIMVIGGLLFIALTRRPDEA